MISVSVNQAQLKELQGKLDPKKFSSAIDIALFRIGQGMENIAKERVPWDTGTLSRSITTKKTKTDVMTGTDVIYARIHEYGGMTGRGHRTKIKARPYLRPALQKMEEGGAIKIITEEINRIIK